MKDQILVSEIESILNQSNLPCIALNISGNYTVFCDALSQAKASNPYGAFVADHSEGELVEKRGIALISNNNECGVAVLGDGNITGVFKSGKSELKQILPSLLITAIAYGGNKLDCFGSNQLLTAYCSLGFVPVAKTPFDMSQAPSGWNYQRDGTPDIYFMIHNGDTPEEVAKKLGSYPSPELSEVRELKEYQDAYIYRDSLIEKK